MAQIPDKANICLRCAYGEIYGRGKAKDEAEMHALCSCTNSKVRGHNKGRRFTCRHHEPKKEDQACKD